MCSFMTIEGTLNFSVDTVYNTFDDCVVLSAVITNYNAGSGKFDMNSNNIICNDLCANMVLASIKY